MVLEIQGRVIIYPLQDKEGIYQLLAYLSKICTSKQKITQTSTWIQFFFGRAGTPWIKVWLFLQNIFLKLYCTMQIPLTQSMDNLFLSFVHWLCNWEKTLSMFPLYIGLAKQNSICFNSAGRLAALLPLLNYYAHFSWNRREENSNLFFFFFFFYICVTDNTKYSDDFCHLKGDKNHQNIWYYQ